jgi:hypothetical protein
MFVVVRILVCIALVAAVGCRSKPKKQAPPANVETAGSNAGGMTAAPDLDLPHGPGTPPMKTTAPLTSEQYTKLAELKFPGFGLKPRVISDKGMEVRQITNDFPKIMTTISITPCTNTTIAECHPLEVDKWKDDKNLKNILLPELRDLPDTIWEVTTNTLYGQTLIETYQLAFKPQDAKGHAAYADAVALYYNDGINQIRIVSQYGDDPVDRATMMKKAPRADLELVAKSFLDVYTHAWVPTS